MDRTRPTWDLARSLPPLREDLALIEAAPRRDGSPAWMVHDPVANRFYRLGWLEFELLSRWRAPTAGQALSQTRDETGLTVSADELANLVDFLARHHLLRASEPGAAQALVDEAARAHDAKLKRLLHDYLFFRIALVRPQAWLERWLPRVRFVASPAFLGLTAAVTVAGILLALRQWDVFLHSLGASMSLSGLLGYAVALAVAKTLHELGHAFTAAHFRIRVAHMGVAFLVLWPMLYTDTGEAWKLADRRQRFRIAAAGMAVELGLAGFATLAWSLAPDGAVRDALFFLATVSWVMTVAINASPFMRFDGYFLLSDALDLPNLHQRAFAQARHALRHAVLGRGPAFDPPEAFEPGPRRALIAFAWLTWLWRLVVFVGIALAVYHFFFKALGIVLFAVEIAWFVVRPLVSEVGQWASLRRHAQAGHVARSLLVALAVLGLLLIPWRGVATAEGLLRAEHQQVLYAPVPARLAEALRVGEREAGDGLARLDSPDIRQQVQERRVATDGLERQLLLSVGTAQGRERRGLIAERLQGQLVALAGEEARLARLAMTAPFRGYLTDVDEGLKPGVWIAPGQPMAILHDPRSWIVDAYLEQQQVARIRVGATARFYRHGHAGAPLIGTVQAIDADRQQRFAHPLLAVDHGGRLPALRGPDGQLTPRDALYRVRILIDTGGTVPAGVRWRESPGAVRIEAERRSLLLDWGRHALSVLIRESGF